jgi:aminoglycoside 3-N-acetyltransferase
LQPSVRVFQPEGLTQDSPGQARASRAPPWGLGPHIDPRPVRAIHASPIAAPRAKTNWFRRAIRFLHAVTTWSLLFPRGQKQKTGRRPAQSLYFNMILLWFLLSFLPCGMVSPSAADYFTRQKMEHALTQSDISRGLRELGLARGDIVVLHASLASMGRVDGGAAAVVDAFLDVVGESGALVAPAFGKLGAIADAVAAHPRAVKSVHPLAAAAAIGAPAEALCRAHWKAELAHAADTPWGRAAELGGYVCLLGVDQDRNTTLHAAEEILRLPYLKPHENVAFDTPEGRVTKTFPFFPGPHRDFIGLDKMLRESGKMRMGRIGAAAVRLIKGKDLIDLAVAAGRADPEFVLCGNPACEDCRLQRADLRRSRFKAEPFTLAASAMLAGRYAEEIVDRCRFAGVDAVELDGLRGRPLEMLDDAAVHGAVAALRDAGLRVTALRAAADSDSMERVMDWAAGLDVRRVVAPLTGRAEKHARAAAERAVDISFFNMGIGGAQAGEILLGLKAKGLKAGFAFHAADFARAGEKPFLKSFKTKVRRFVDQLDVSDALFDGAPARLAEGNAEIKEMVSILRCSGFAGFVVLGAENARTGSLEDTVRDMVKILDGM